MKSWIVTTTVFMCFLFPLCAADAPTVPAKLREQVGKPMTIAGTTVDGKELSTESLKGKVILVDFWATWCGPCVEELPHVKKLVDQYHEKGFEVVGVANDFKVELLKKFLVAHPEYSWPHLFDPKAAKEDELHSIATGFGIDALPVMVLIDKKGVCRSVKAAGEMDELIPKLLAE